MLLLAIGAAPVTAASPYGADPTIAWQKLLGGGGSDRGQSVQPTADGGYILLAQTDSSASGDVAGTNHGESDIWVVKLDGTGAIQWQKLLGGNSFDRGHSIQQTADGGYILLGDTLSSASGDVAGTNHGTSDIWVVKLDGTGVIQWQKLLGGSEGDYGNSLRQTSDGGYILFGYSQSS
ncbi:MAG: hypothetical protein ABFC89_06220, partial [Methanospirillum sp.]